MPKEQRERIIDQPYRQGTRIVTAGGGGGGGGGSGATNLDGLSDVTLTTPANGQSLIFNSASGQWINGATTAGPHALSNTAIHTGLLNWNLLNFSGSSLGDLATRSHSLLTGIGPNDHHNQSHVLATGTALGPDHTISGASAGEVLRALGPTTAAFDQLQHTDLGNVLPDQHHRKAHDIIRGDADDSLAVIHTISGPNWSLVGATNVDTLGLLVATPTPGAAAAVLRTDSAGGIQLDTNLLYVDGANNWIGINRAPSGATLDVIAYSNADHTQRIKMKSGQTGRLWRIEDLAGNELIVLDSVGDLQSGRPGFVSGLTGWQITPQGNAEFNNIWARGELHATVFVKDEVHATGGTLLVATAGTLHDDASINSSTVDDDVLCVVSTPAGNMVPLQVVTTSGTFTGNELHVSWIGNTITINDPPSGPGFYFQPGDIIRSKTEVTTGVTDFWLEVNSATQNSGYATYSVTKRSGTDGTLPKGSAVVSYGKQGDGRILMTSDLNYAPYIDVFTVGPNVWTGAAGAIVPRMRMGRLDGIGLPGISGVEQYGLVAGKDLSDANTGYLIASNLQFSLYKIDIRLNNGSTDTGLWSADGNLKIGSNIGALATTGFQVITTGARAGDVVIGNEASGNYMRWQQSSGILVVSGSLVTTDPGGTVTLTQMTAADNAVRSDAADYANAAQTNSQNYGDARRVVAVSGTWASSSGTNINWGSPTVVQVKFANGAAKNITTGSLALSAGRTYLYVDVTAGTLTMLNNQAISAISANHALIAVADTGTNKASINIVAGSTYISGNNIMTGSIVASNIATNTITAAQIAANTITAAQIAAGTITGDRLVGGTITSTQIDPTYTSAIGDAQTNAQSYGESRRVTGVSGTWTVTDGDSISWGSPAALQVKFANGSARTITAGSFTLSAGRTYLFVDVTAGTLTMSANTSLSVMTANHALIAVADTGTYKASISVVAGSTYISGSNIMTGSIVAANIRAGSITANEIAANTITTDKMLVYYLGAITQQVGSLIVDTLGSFKSTGKTFYGNPTAGFWLGYDSGVAKYRFDLGDNNNYMRWDGTSLLLKTNQPLDLTSSASDAIFNFTSWRGGSPASMLFNQGGDPVFTFSHPITATRFTANDLLTINYATGLTAGDVIKITLSGISNAGSDTFRYDRSGGASQLTYSGAMIVNGSFIASGQVISNSNAIRIANSFTPANSTTPAGSVGEIRWDSSFIYVWIGGSWRRATLNIF